MYKSTISRIVFAAGLVVFIGGLKVIGRCVYLQAKSLAASFANSGYISQGHLLKLNDNHPAKTFTDKTIRLICRAGNHKLFVIN